MPDSNQDNHHSDQQEQNIDLFLRSSYSRRLFLKQAVASGAAGLLGPGLLTACGNENAAERSESETTVSKKCQESADLPHRILRLARPSIT